MGGYNPMKQVLYEKDIDKSYLIDIDQSYLKDIDKSYLIHIETLGKFHFVKRRQVKNKINLISMKKTTNNPKKFCFLYLRAHM